LFNCLIKFCLSAIIKFNDISSNATIILEYFKKNNMIYINPTTSSVENNIYDSNLLTIDEYKNKLN
jgi:hypothetical protein